MPYIAIKGYPKDEKTKQEVVERINQTLLELWGCPQEAISISVEEFDPAVWEEEVVKPEIDANVEKMFIYAGEKRY